MAFDFRNCHFFCFLFGLFCIRLFSYVSLPCWLLYKCLREVVCIKYDRSREKVDCIARRDFSQDGLMSKDTIRGHFTNRDLNLTALAIKFILFSPVPKQPNLHKNSTELNCNIEILMKNIIFLNKTEENDPQSISTNYSKLSFRFKVDVVLSSDYHTWKVPLLNDFLI